MESTTHQVDKILHQWGGVFFFGWEGGGDKTDPEPFFFFTEYTKPRNFIREGKKQANKQTNKQKTTT